MSASVLNTALQAQRFQDSPDLPCIMQLRLCMQCLCVERPSGILEKIGKAVCPANFVV